MGEAVEQGGLAGVGVADQRDGGVRRALPGGAVQGTGAPNLLQFALQLDDPVGDLAAV